MQKNRRTDESMQRSRWLLALAIGVALAVLAGVVVFTTLQVRQRIREQITARNGEVLYAVAVANYTEDMETGSAGADTVPGDPLGVVLRSAELRGALGVLGVRLFDAEGQFIASFPPYVTESELTSEQLTRLKQLRPISLFHRNAQMATLFYPDETAPTGTVPLLDVLVPLHAKDAPPTSFAQFLVEGHNIAADLVRLDHSLEWQAAIAFCTGGTILSVAFLWAFKRLGRANQLLCERTENLLKANQELALAAKTSALGTVAAHLIHGLKNPLAGLQNFVVSRGAAPDNAEEFDWQQAAASTRRMQTMINQVVGVLREEQGGARYDVTLSELEQIVRSRVQPLAVQKGVSFTSLIQTKGALPNRVANLAALILVNLVENALQATDSQKTVTLTVNRQAARIVFEVRDEGTGFPSDTTLFVPCRTSKEGGTGIGLALCKQLANHLGAELELARSTSSGCVFALILPDPAGLPGGNDFRSSEHKFQPDDQ
jgi:signal transduction histidine kinase